MFNNNSIGLFDSGIGGTSIWKAIHQLMPNENTLFLADSKNAPYGVKSKDEIIALSCKNTEFLLNHNCKIIVVACNTATTNAIKVLRANYDVPFIGIEPAIKPAALHSKTQKIGILATKGTINSELFHNSLQQYKNVTFMEQIGHGLVELIEAGEINSPAMQTLLKTYLEPMIAANIDYLVLGCSHYPYLIPQIKALLPSSIQIIDSGEAVARQTQKMIHDHCGFHDPTQPSNQVFYTNTSPRVLQFFLGAQYAVIQNDF